jgi:hypothetical protein
VGERWRNGTAAGGSGEHGTQGDGSDEVRTGTLLRSFAAFLPSLSVPLLLIASRGQAGKGEARGEEW